MRDTITANVTIQGVGVDAWLTSVEKLRGDGPDSVSVAPLRNHSTYWAGSDSHVKLAGDWPKSDGAHGALRATLDALAGLPNLELLAKADISIAIKQPPPLLSECGELTLAELGHELSKWQRESRP